MEAAAIFAPVIKQYTANLLSRIAVDYNISNENLVFKYMYRSGDSKTKPVCTSLTAKKTPCKNRCLPNSDKCCFHIPKKLTIQIQENVNIEEYVDVVVDDEPESPGAIIHRMKLAAKGRVPEYDEYSETDDET
jgi:hypothetical protein